MKKSILIFCAVFATISLMAFGYINWSNTETDFDSDLVESINKSEDPEFIYDINNRFINTVTKEKLNSAKSIIDILPRKATKSTESYRAVQVDIIDKASVPGDSDVLNAAQLYLLQSADFSTDIYIKADYKKRNSYTGELEDGNLTYYISVIPDRVAQYTSGQDALIKYLKENSKKETAIVTEDQLQPGKVSFTVTKEGTIANVELTSTSGYDSIDKKMVELISSIPGEWNPATDSKGKRVNQKLVFFFGLIGC